MQTILIVDDSKFTRERIKSMFENGNYRVIEASDGNSCMLKITNDNPDCVILDLLMPNKSGIEVLEELKRENSLVPVIIMSAEIQETVKKQCLDLGARAFINKPPSKDELNEILDSTLKEKI